MFYDYLSIFEASEEKAQKITRFLDSLTLGRIGAKAKEEFYVEQDNQMLDDNNDDNDMDEKQLVNLEISE